MAVGDCDPSLGFEAAIRLFFLERNLDLRVPALVGYSGGPDSSALLHSLSALGAGPLTALHVDHGLRPEAERSFELEIIRNTTASLGIPLRVARIRPGLVEELARRQGSGIEAAARWYRRRCFARAMKEGGLERLYLGHSAEDSLENILMALLRGAGAAGLRGIAPVSGNILRPLSALSKAEILAYLKARNLEWSLDSTNADSRMLRNRVRASLIPVLDKEFTGWRSGLRLAAIKAGLEEETLRDLDPASRFEPGPGREYVVGAKEFRAATRLLRIRSLIDAYSRIDEGLGGGRRFSGGRVSFRMVSRALDAIEGGGSYVAHGTLLEWVGERLRLAPALDFEGRRGYFVVIGKHDTSGDLRLGFGMSLGVSLSEKSRKGSLPDSSFEFPVIVRSRRAGDSIRLESGGKAIDTLLSEWRVPKAQRSRVPIVEDARGIVAVLGMGFGKGRNRLRAERLRPEAKRFLSLDLKGA